MQPPVSSSSYLDGWTVLVLVVGLVVAAVCAIAGLRGRSPGRLTLGATAVLQVATVVLLGSYTGRLIGGEQSRGPAWELWAYLVTVLMLPACAWVWARAEGSRWGSFVLALAAFVAAVMSARAAQIWYGVGMA